MQRVAEVITGFCLKQASRITFNDCTIFPNLRHSSKQQRNKITYCLAGFEQQHLEQYYLKHNRQSCWPEHTFWIKPESTFSLTFTGFPSLLLGLRDRCPLSPDWICTHQMTDTAVACSFAGDISRPCSLCFPSFLWPPNPSYHRASTIAMIRWLIFLCMQAPLDRWRYSDRGSYSIYGMTFHSSWQQHWLTLQRSSDTIQN